MQRLDIEIEYLERTARRLFFSKGKRYVSPPLYNSLLHLIDKAKDLLDVVSKVIHSATPSEQDEFLSVAEIENARGLCYAVNQILNDAGVPALGEF